ncbi:MAG: class I SAM-dependent methyltransferase [Maricaulaceae bacterium]|nr:class I SAM-dependent methyltransferase [Maricaulaceae bacterium]
MALLDPFLRRFIRTGQFTLIAPDGRAHVYGAGEPAVSIRVHDRRTLLRLALDPELTLGEAYMDGRLTVEAGGGVYELLSLLARNRKGPKALSWLDGLRRAAGRLTEFNDPRSARRNIARHYDLSGQLYDLFLDRDRQYSCAYFPTGKESLDAAQEAKKRHIIAKLLLKPGMKVLDIGCGWGGLALSLAKDAEANVDGITLSQEQFAIARRRAQEQGLSRRARFALQDYRKTAGRYDRIVSVGMFEHVGKPQYRVFFDAVTRLLADDGVALVHTIGRLDEPQSIGPWIRKYIFPGGHIPALSEVAPVIERAGLILTDVEVLRLHYAETLRHWRTRFVKNRDKAVALYDERFFRMWEFYLAGSEAGFRDGPLAVFQFQLARRHGAVPVTRDYITDFHRTGSQAAGRASAA